MPASIRTACREFRRFRRELAELRKLVRLRDAIRLLSTLKYEPDPVAVHCKPLGREVWLRPGTSDMGVFSEVLAARDYEFACWDIEPRLIVDAGANIGMATLYFAHLNPQARIIAIEPEESNIELLRRNTAGLERVSVKAAALWPYKTRLHFNDSDAEKWAFSVKEASPRSDGVAAVTIPEILAETGAERIDLLKIDIEGAEKELFSDGWEEWLPRIGRIVIELHDRLVPGCSTAFYQAILSRRFTQHVGNQNLAVDFIDHG